MLDWSSAKNVTVASLRRFARPLLSIRGERTAAREQLRKLNTCPTIPIGSCACCPAATSRRSCSRDGCSATAAFCCSTSRPAGVDVRTKAELYRIITDLARAGVGVLVVSSELEELVGICTRILVMREGEIVAEIDGGAATERELLRHAVAPTDSPDLEEEVV